MDSAGFLDDGLHFLTKSEPSVGFTLYLATGSSGEAD